MSRLRRSLIAMLATIVLAAVAGGVSSSVVAGRAPATARIESRLASLLDAAAVDVQIPVFVHATDARTAEGAIAATGMGHVETFERVGVAFAVGTPAQIEAIGHLPGITYLQSNRPLDFGQDTSHRSTRMDVASGAFTASDGTPLDGSGIGVAIVDSGVRSDHPSFGDRVKVNLKYVCGTPFDSTCYRLGAERQGDTRDEFWQPVTDSDTTSAGGHGTHVVGIAAAGASETADGLSFRGAAPGADIVSLSVGAAIAVYGAASALNWVVEHHANPCEVNTAEPRTCAPIRVVNNSYGSGVDEEGNAAPFDPEGITAKLQAELVDDGITMVWAAGNDGGTGSQDRVNPEAKDPRPGVIGVANYDDGDVGTPDGTLNASSSRGAAADPTTWPDISAPGTSILSTCGPGLAICRGSYTGDPDYGIISGTSMAAPHIAGYVAVLLDANPTLTPGQIEFVLEETAYKFTFGHPYVEDPRHPGATSSADKGHGLVDMASAVARVIGQAAPARTTIRPACAPGVSAARDVEGDAAVGAGASNPSLDLVGVELRRDGDQLVGRFAVKDLRGDTEDPTPPSGGEAFDLEFEYAGEAYYLRAQRRFPQAGSYSFRKSGGTAGAGDTTVSAATGSFDATAEVVTVSVPIAALPNFSGSAELRSLTATAWSVEGALLVGTDSAGLPCPVHVRTASVGANGYRMVAADGGIFTFGDRRFHGSTGDLVLNKPIVGGATDISDYDGYWIVASDGGVFTFGAEFHGSLGGQTLPSPAVEIEPTPTGKGYWIVLANGKVYTFGDANFFGDISATRLNKPVIGMSVTPSGQGYWLVAEDGGIFNYGDAEFFGSMGDQKLNAPVIDLAPAVDNDGYYLLGRDGGVFTFGSADFKGSTGSMTLNAPVVAMLVTPSGAGYWLAASDGGIFTFGAGAEFLGSMGGTKLNSPVLDLIN